MKGLFFAVMASFALPMLLIAQPAVDQKTADQKAPQLEVQMQKLPSNQEGNYYDAGTYVPQTSVDQLDAPRPASEQPKAGTERTLSIIKPDGVKNNHIGEIIARYEKAGLHVVAIKMVKLSKEQAEQFYQEHRERPFYRDLVDSMTSGPVVMMVLEGDQAVSKNRELMGATDPKKADKGTIRADFAKNVTQNTVHGSDSPESARREVLFFFPPNEMQNRF